jgi:hypothetical protein
MIEMKIESPVEINVWRLRQLGKDLGEARKPLLQALATAAKKWVQGRMGAFIGQRTGWLKRHVYGIRRSEEHFVVAAPRHIAEPLERGATIVPKKGKYLTLRGGGSMVRVKSVTIPARKWFTRSYEGFEGSSQYEAALDKAIQKAVDKFGSSAVEVVR